MIEVHVEDNKTRFDDYDFKECMKYAPFGIDDISEIIACSAGEADGADWHYICKLKDGKYGHVTGGCDYTGWGCQESGDGFIGTLEACVDQVPEGERRVSIQGQIDGTQPYGLTTLQ